MDDKRTSLRAASRPALLGTTLLLGVSALWFARARTASRAVIPAADAVTPAAVTPRPDSAPRVVHAPVPPAFGPRAAPPPVAPVRPAVVSAPISALLDPHTEGAVKLQAALETAVATCMEQRGFPYAAQGDEAGGAGEVDPNEAHLSQLPEAEAKRWRTALLGAAALAPDDAHHARTVLDVDDGVSLAWADEGCAAIAERALYGDEAVHRNLTMQLALLRDRAEQEADGDGEYRASLRDYATCMRARGRTIADSVLNGEDSLDVESDDTDRACRASAGLAERRQRAVARAEEALAESHAHDLTAYRTLQDEALEGLDAE